MTLGYRALFHALVGCYLKHELGRTLLTALGIALGVAVLVAVDLANESAVASFRQNLVQVAGRADLTLRGNIDGLDPRLVGQLARDRRLESISPLISGTVELADNPTQRLLLLGIDILQSTETPDERVRDLQLNLADDLGFGSILVDTGAIVVSEGFLNDNNVALGDSITLRLPIGERSLKVVGSISSNSYTDSFDSGIAVVDLGVADVLLGRGGKLDRIDLVLQQGVVTSSIQEELTTTLGPSVVVESPEGRGERANQMLAAFRFNLRALGQISILIGAFLVYNAMSVAVVRRRPVIGTLRALGVRRGAVATVFLIEGLLLGLVGTVLGLLAGVLMALSLLDVVSDAISINFFETRATGLALSPRIIAMAAVLGIGGALLAAAGPAWDAATTPPANTMRRGSEQTGGRLTRWLPVFGGLLLIPAVYLLRREPPSGVPIQGYVASALFIAAFVLCSRLLLVSVSKVLQFPLRRLFRAEGLIAAAQVRANALRSSVAVCGLLISIGMAISVSIMIGSFRETVTTWMNQILVADLYISPEGSSPGRQITLPGSLRDDLVHLDGIDRIDAFRGRKFLFNGVEATLGAGQLLDSRFRNRVVDGRSVPEAFRAVAENESFAVSEAFARKHGIQRGDRIEIPTATGVYEAEVEAVYYDYSSEQGFVLIDLNLYRKLFADESVDSLAIFLAAGADQRRVMEAVNGVLSQSDLPPVNIRSNTTLREFALAAFDRTFAITYILQIIAIAVAVLGVTTTLLAQLIDRRAEIQTLRTIGATRRRLLGIVMCESFVICIAGMLPGIAAGIVLSYILSKVIMMQSFGWTIVYTISPMILAQIGLIVLVGVLIAAIIPAREALKGTSSNAMLYR